MKNYWAIDYVDSYDCELICDDQLYETEEAALEVMNKLPRPDLHEVTSYTPLDLPEIYGHKVTISEDLKILY